MANNFTNECFASAAKAAGGNLTDDEVMDAFDDILAEKERLQRTGQTDRMAERLREYAERKAEQTKIAAALQKRHAALNVLARDRLDRTIDGFIAAGMAPHKAILAIMEGTQKGVEGGRNSVAAQKLAYEGAYAGGAVADLRRDVPAFERLFRDRGFDDAVAREMYELRDGGKPGATGNADARKVAAIFAKYAEIGRQDANRFGAAIGKLDGWAGVQTHDDIRMIAAGKDEWVAYILPRLDLDRTFDGIEVDEAQTILADIYDTIITGVPAVPTTREKGGRVNPANLAKSLGKSRVLHFRGPDASAEYRARFGHGSTTSGLFAHLRRLADINAQMEVFGPNPEVMVGAIIDSQARKIRDGNLLPDEKAAATAKLRFDGGAIRDAFDVMSGLATRPVNVTAASIGTDIRAGMAMAKLGGAIFTAMPSDTVTAGIASMFRGSGFWPGIFRQLDGIRRGRGAGELGEVTALLGESFDGAIGRIMSPAIAADAPPGRFSRLQELFFRANGLTWWTDVSRGAAVRTIAAEMGMRAAVDYAALPANYRHVLSLHGIDAVRWEAIRSVGVREVNGRSYVTPDRIRHVDDALVAPLVADRLKVAKTDDARATIIEQGRRDLEMSVRRFFADEVNYSVIETDARSRRTSTMGATRPGTLAGEAVRYFMQFKGFPIAFSQRVLGRAMFGQAADASMVQNGAHIGAIIAGLGVAGYMSMVIKDLAKGYWPPRDPTDPKVWAAALVQGGAFGIYGDFLFGEVNRYGGDPVTTFAGPAVGSAGDLLKLWFALRDSAIDPDAKVRSADFLNFAVNNTPFANLFYVRPALDFLALNALKEATSPGYLKRQERRRLKDYGQASFVPR